MKTFKEFLKEQNVSEDDFSKKSPEEMAKLYNDYNAACLKAIQTDVDGKASKSDIPNIEDALKGLVKEDALKDLASKKEINDLKEIVKNQGNAMKKFETTSTNEVFSLKEDIVKQINDRKEEFNAWKSDSSKGGRFVLYETKAPAAVTTANVTSDTVPVSYANTRAEVYSPYIREEIFVEDFFDRGTTDKPSLAYINETAGEGDAAIVAEGGLKPLIDADYVTKFSEARKIAGRMKVSEEALSDYPWLQSAMTTTLKRKHDIARQNQLISGDGTGSNLLGITNLATPYAAGMLTGIAASVESANEYDVIAAMQTAIAVQSEGTFMANVVFVNNIDALKMKLTKDTDNNYIMPPFISADGRVIDGVTIVAKPTIPVGDFIIGDFRNVSIRDVWGYRVEIGRSGDDFAENMYTMIGESRLHLYITDNDKRGIIYGDFATVKAALETV